MAISTKANGGAEGFVHRSESAERASTAEKLHALAALESLQCADGDHTDGPGSRDMRAPAGGQVESLNVNQPQRALARLAGLRAEPTPFVVVPYSVMAQTQRTLAVRTAGDPNLLLNPVRAQVRAAG